jgi:hypothetical protein
MLEIYQNKQSGKYFIFVDHISEDRLLLVTPNNRVKAIETKFFEDPIIDTMEYFLANDLLTEAQVQTYRNYKENRKLDKEAAFLSYFEGWTPQEIDSFIKYCSQIIKDNEASGH